MIEKSQDFFWFLILNVVFCRYLVPIFIPVSSIWKYLFHHIFTNDEDYVFLTNLIRWKKKSAILIWFLYFIDEVGYFFIIFAGLFVFHKFPYFKLRCFDLFSWFVRALYILRKHFNGFSCPLFFYTFLHSCFCFFASFKILSSFHLFRLFLPPISFIPIMHKN